MSIATISRSSANVLPALPQGLSPELAAWVENFRRERDRSPRILHIGNVGNNGYNNAKLLNRAGLDCDAICYDYYHIMGCPEWEDADYTGDIRSDFYPTWTQVDLRDFERPRWFAQGPLHTCIDYLVARREGRTEDAEKLWVRLIDQREATCAHLRGELAGPSLWSKVTKLAGKVMRKFWKIPYLIALRVQAINWLMLSLGRSPFIKNVRRLCTDFERVFPDRADKLKPVEFRNYALNFPKWRKLFGHYDLVCGYATDGYAPMLDGNVPYIAFEHGTIRNIPFEPTTQGRLCALTYRLSDVAFVTNCDNNIAAERLKLPSYKWVPHPINEDDHSTTDSERVKRDVRAKLDSEFVIFHPSRHHWDAQRDTSWDKGNDILIEGFARFVKEVCPKAGAVFVEWGQTLKQSRDLLAKHGIERNVLWIAPQPTPRMNAYVQAADVLADQFCIGTFGGIMPKGLLFGTPNLIYLDEEVHRWCLPKFPPVLNARTPDEVFNALKRLYEDPEYARQIAEDGRTWYAKHHSSRVVADAFTEAVRSAVARARPRKES